MHTCTDCCVTSARRAGWETPSPARRRTLPRTPAAGLHVLKIHGFVAAQCFHVSSLIDPHRRQREAVGCPHPHFSDEETEAQRGGSRDQKVSPRAWKICPLTPLFPLNWLSPWQQQLAFIDHWGWVSRSALGFACVSVSSSHSHLYGNDTVITVLQVRVVEHRQVTCLESHIWQGSPEALNPTV